MILWHALTYSEQSVYCSCVAFIKAVTYIMILTQTKSSLEKTKQGLELDRSVMEDEIKELTTSRGDLEKKKKALEGQVMELQARVTEDNNRITELQAVNTKLQVICGVMLVDEQCHVAIILSVFVYILLEVFLLDKYPRKADTI